MVEEAEAAKWKTRWQAKADAFEVQEQTIAVLSAENARLKRELDLANDTVQMNYHHCKTAEARAEKAEREYEIEKIHAKGGYDAAAKFKSELETATATIAQMREALVDGEPKFNWENEDGEARQRHVRRHEQWAEDVVRKIRAALLAAMEVGR